MGISGLRRDHFPVEGRTAVITGGSQGMGKAVAKQLARQGAHIAIVARNEKKLENALGEIQACAKFPKSQRFTYLSADLSDPEATEDMVEAATSWNMGEPPDIMWCCAGGARPGFFTEVSTRDLKTQMDQNYFSTAYTCHAILRSWLEPSTRPLTPEQLKAAPRQLILTSSVVAFYTITGYGAYAPAKGALRFLADTLRQEVEIYNGSRHHHTSSASGASYGPSHPVNVAIIYPGSIASPGLEQENRHKPAITFELEKDDGVQTEDEVALASVKGLQRGEYMVVTKFLSQAMRANMWGGEPRNYWLWDLILGWVVGIVWLFVGPLLDRKVRNWGRQQGHPAGYPDPAVAKVEERVLENGHAKGANGLNGLNGHDGVNGHDAHHTPPGSGESLPVYASSQNGLSPLTPAFSLKESYVAVNEQTATAAPPLERNKSWKEWITRT